MPKTPLIDRYLFIVLGLFLLTACLILTLPICTWAVSDLDRLREAEVTKAREGHLKESIATLETYRLDYPDNIPLISDLIVLYSWNSDHEKVVALYLQNSPDSYPYYVYPPVINSFRTLGKTEEALDIVNFLLERDESDNTLLLKKIQLLVDLERYQEAHESLDDISRSDKIGADRFRVAGYLYSAQSDWLQALQQYQRILTDIPDDPEAIVGTVNALLNLGAPHAAEKHALARTELFDIEKQVDILRTKAALMLRWSSHAYDNSEDALMLASRALMLHLIALGILPSQEQYNDLRRKIEYDMVVSLTYLRRHDDSYSLYLSLLEYADVPPYVSQAAAQSLLALRRPSEAISLIQKVIEAEPENYQAKLLLFYAYIENEQFADSFELIDGTIERTPPFKRFDDSPEQYRNDERLELEIIASQARLYADQLADAWNRISTLKNMAPANEWLVQITGETALAREWPRLAYGYFQEAHRLNPDVFDTLEGMAQSHITLHNYNDAQEILDTLKLEHPAEAVTERLERDLYWAQRPDLWADLELSYSEGPEQSGDGIVASGELISSPINQFLHLSVQGRYAWSEIPEGEVSLTRYGGGVEFIKQPFALLALANYNESTIDEPGGVVRGIWTPDDHWYFSLQGDRFSDVTPLRALYYGIWTDRIAGSAGYRWHEGSQMAFNLNSGWFTDDNHRLESGLNYTGRIIDIPRFDLDGIVDVYGSTNTRDDAPYYNPKSDLKIKATLTGEHIIHRYYERSFVHQLSAGLGIYAQQDFETGPIGSLRYELRYTYLPRLEARLAGEIGQNRYDGEDEPYYKFNFMIHAKF